MAQHQSTRFERPSIASAAQKRANRRNAKRSTGPRTDAGKLRASRNATTHGCFASDLVLPGEDPAELRALRRGIVDSQAPQDSMEWELVDTLTAAQWKLRRLRGAEREALASITERRNGRAMAELMRMSRRSNPLELLARFAAEEPDADADDANDDANADADTRDRQGPANRATPRTGAKRKAAAPERTAAQALAADFADGPDGVIDRISRYQQRLEQSIHRVLRELRQMRKDRRDFGALPPSPYLDDDPEGDAETDPEHDLRDVASIPPADGATDGTESSIESPDDAAKIAPADACEASQPVEASDDVPSKSIVQNEANSADTAVDDGAARSCEHGSCNVELIRPTRLAPGHATAREAERSDVD